jgi:hypothetical protein
MSGRGRFVVDREVFDEPLLRDAECFRAWMWLVSEAAWEPRRQPVSNGRATAIIELQRGQLTHSLTYMARAWNVSVKRVRTILGRFETGSLIGTQTGTLQTVITICNYDASQDIAGAKGTQTGSQTGTQRARKGHGTNTLNTFNKERGLAPPSAGPVAKPERKPETFTEDEWRDRLKTFRVNGQWPERYYGPKPGNPDCLVPRHLLVKPIDKQMRGAE